MRTATHRLAGLVLTGHEYQVPLDYAQPNGEQITVFAREVGAAGQEERELPWLVYFQGGPGAGAPRPLENSGWIKRAVQEYRLLLLDQRGTGLSTPVTTQTLAALPSPRAQAAYLQHFRADNIVRDAELIRKALVGETAQWSGLGQSYGGFCLTHYLSAAPQGLRAVIITGGLPPLARSADEVYRATYQRVGEKNHLYYARYPEDVARVGEVVRYLQAHQVILPRGGQLTARRFQQLGLDFGASDGFERIHYLLEEAFVTGAGGRALNRLFLEQIEELQDFERKPIFAILHEAIYCQGAASNWAAQRVRSEYPEFDLDPSRPPYFTGEMVYPWMFDDYAQLQPLKEAAELLAAQAEWPHLYDVAALRHNRVPTVAAVYYDDMYVDRELSLESARQIGGIMLWITNEYQHNGLRADGERLLGRLLELLHGAG